MIFLHLGFMMEFYFLALLMEAFVFLRIIEFIRDMEMCAGKFGFLVGK